MDNVHYIACPVCADIQMLEMRPSGTHDLLEEMQGVELICTECEKIVATVYMHIGEKTARELQ